jgi:hypothetical protein
VAQARNTVKAKALTPTITKHSHDLRIFLSLFLKFQLTFGLLAISLTPPSILSALSYGACQKERHSKSIVRKHD